MKKILISLAKNLVIHMLIECAKQIKANGSRDIITRFLYNVLHTDADTLLIDITDPYNSLAEALQNGKVMIVHTTIQDDIDSPSIDGDTFFFTKDMTQQERGSRMTALSLYVKDFVENKPIHLSFTKNEKE